jgi:hypothetical protein
MEVHREGTRTSGGHTDVKREKNSPRPEQNFPSFSTTCPRSFTRRATTSHWAQSGKRERICPGMPFLFQTAARLLLAHSKPQTSICATNLVLDFGDPVGFGRAIRLHRRLGLQAGHSVATRWTGGCAPRCTKRRDQILAARQSREAWLRNPVAQFPVGNFSRSGPLSPHFAAL